MKGRVRIKKPNHFFFIFRILKKYELIIYAHNYLKKYFVVCTYDQQPQFSAFLILYTSRK